MADFADNTHWRIEFASGQFAGLTSEELNWRCETVPIPKRNTEKLAVQIRNLPPVHQPGNYFPSENSMTVTLFETVDNKVLKSIADHIDQTHYKLKYNDTQQGRAGKTRSESQIQIKIKRLDRQYKTIATYTFYGCFIESYEPGGDLGSGTAEVLKPTITFSYDDFSEDYA